MKKKWIIFALLLFSACAVVENPTGGPADTSPPVIVQKTPGDSTTHFKSKNIQLVFNEFITLQNPEKQILLNPFSPKLNIKLQRKKLLLTLPDSLLPNTTYSISFLQAIKDITEGNTIPLYRYVFSTGNTLDSCKIRVKVLDPLTTEPQKNVWVGLYSNLADFEKKHPDYLLPSATDGTAEFSFLPKNKSFFATALQDANYNYFFDLKDEKIAFTSHPLLFPDTGKCMVESTLYLFSDQEEKQKFLRITSYHFQSALALFALPLAQPKLTFLKPASSKDVFTIIQKDSIFFFVKDKKIDSLKVIVEDTGNFKDTLQIGLKIKIRSKNPLSDTLVKLTTNLSNMKIRSQDTFIVKTKVPIQSINKEKIFLYALKDTTPLPLPPYELDSSRREIYFTLPKTDSSFLFVMKKGALIDLWGYTSDSMKTEIHVLSDDKLGSITVILQNTDPSLHYIAYVKKDKNLWIQPFTNDTARFERLFSGTYSLQLLIDKYPDRKWTNGSWQEKREPEFFMTYPGNVEVKEKWENRIIWKL